jgi:hypothetical protein
VLHVGERERERVVQIVPEARRELCQAAGTLTRRGLSVQLKFRRQVRARDNPALFFGRQGNDTPNNPAALSIGALKEALAPHGGGIEAHLDGLGAERRSDDVGRGLGVVGARRRGRPRGRAEHDPPREGVDPPRPLVDDEDHDRQGVEHRAELGVLRCEDLAGLLQLARAHLDLALQVARQRQERLLGALLRIGPDLGHDPTRLTCDRVERVVHDNVVPANTAAVADLEDI